MRILIVDDHQLFIDGIRHIINSLDDSVEIIEANSAIEAVQYLDSSISPDLMLLDLQLPGMSSTSLMQNRWVRDASLPIVIISGEEDLPAIKQVIDAGVMGFIPKSYSAISLHTALRTILDGENYIPEAIQNQIHDLATDNARINSPATMPFAIRRSPGASMKYWNYSQKATQTSKFRKCCS